MGDIILTVDDGQQADAARFFAAGAHLLELLDDLSETTDVEWAVQDLRKASAVAEMAAVGAYREAGVASIDAAMTGLAHIRAGNGVPSTWTPTSITHAKEMVRRAGDNAKLETNGNVVHLDQKLLAELEDIAPWIREFYGSIRGRLTGVNVTRGNRASVKPQGGGRVIQVRFPTALAESMRDGLLQFVEIEGQIRQDDEGTTYFATAERIRTIARSGISWRDLRGYMPEITDGLPINEYLEGIRGDE